MEEGQKVAETALPPSGGSLALEILKPASGAVAIAETGLSKDVVFKFPFAEAKLAILDVDLVAIFEDGSKIIFPGLAVRMLGGDAPRLRFLDQDIDPSSIIARVGEVQLADQLPQLVVSSSLKVEKQDPAAPSNGIPVVQMPSLPPASLTPSPARRGSIDSEIETGSIASTTGRFAKRTNEQTEVASGGASAETESNDPVEAPPAELDNPKPEITSYNGNDQVIIAVDENDNAAARIAGRDIDNEKLHFAIAGGADAELFSINSDTGELYFVNAPNFEAPGSATQNNTYNVTVAVLDELGGFDEQRVAVTVTNVNEAPVSLTLSNNRITEQASAGAVVGRISATDPDAGSLFQFAFAPQGDANGRLLIDALTGIITVAAGPGFDAETMPQETITVRVTDQGGLSLDKVFVLDVTNINEAPVIETDGGGALALVTLPENGSRVTTVNARDPEAQSVTYSLAGGADAALFSIDAITGALRFLNNPNFEAPGDSDGDNRYEVIVRASDGSGFDEQTIHIDVVNANEAPLNATLTAATVLETAAAGTVIGTVVANDPDAGDTISYAFGPGGDAGGRFIIDAITGVVTLAGGVTLDFEINQFFVLSVRLTDAGGLTTDQLFVIQVLDTNDTPDIVSDGGGPTTLIIDIENETAVTTVVAFDPDIGNVLVYSIIGGADAAKFTINANTGVLRFLVAPDFEVPGDADGNNNYELVVSVTDGTTSDQQTITVSVVNDNEAPVITSDGGGAIASLFIVENGVSVTTVTATDPDFGALLVYFISGGADEALFEIDSSTGALRFKNAPDFETPGDADGDNIYEVVVVVSDGGLADLQTIRIAVTNQNEVPTIISDGGGPFAGLLVSENNTAVTTVVGSDSDGSTTLIYSIIGGADQTRFTINPISGVLTFVSAPDFETPSDAGLDGVYDVVVQISDGQGGFDSQAISVSVIDTNDAPIITSNGGGSSATIAVVENTTAVTTVTSLDVDAGATRLYSIIGGADSGLFLINAVTGVLTFAGAGPNFEAPTDADGNNFYEVTVQVSDGLGGIDTQALSIAVTNANESPVNAALSASDVTEGAINGTVIGSVVGIDPDAGATFTYAMVAGQNAGGRFGITADGQVTVANGSLLDFETGTSHSITVRVTDQGGLSVDRTFTISVLNANEAPVITSDGGGASAALMIAENTSGIITTVLSADPDAGATKTYSISGGADAAKFTINATTGALSLIAAQDFETPTDAGGNNVYDVIVQVSDGLGGVDTQAIALTLNNVNEAPTNASLSANTVAENAANGTFIGSVTGVDPDAGAVFSYAFAPGQNAGGRFAITAGGQITVANGSLLDFEAAASHTVTVRVTDQGGLTFDKLLTINLTNANDAPVITSGGGGATAAMNVVENTTTVTTVTASDVDAGAILTYVIVGGADASKFAINATTGVLAFVSPQDVELPTDFNGDGVYEVIVQVSDGLGGIDTQSISVTVTDVNDAPTNASLSANTVAENAGNGTVIGTVTGVDPDAGATLTYAFLPGQDAGGRFSISAGGQITVANGALLNFEAATSHTVTVRTTDQGGLFFDKVFTINLTNVNEAPVDASLSASTVNENAANGTIVGNVTGLDPDAGATFTYAMVAGQDAGGRFGITAGGQITVANGSLLDFETGTSHSITVRVTDQGGLSVDKVFTITVANINEAPTITSDGGGASAARSIAENSTALITTVVATDPDAGATRTYSIAGGADAARFTINATTGALNFIAATQNFEAPNDIGANGIYDVIVQVSDGLGGIDTQAIAVTLTNVNEAPTSANLSANTVVEQAANGTIVGNVTGVDPDAGATFTYAFVAGQNAGGRFAISAGGQITVANGTLLNFEAATSHAVQVRVTDQGGLTFNRTFTINVTNTNEAPTDATLSANTVVENAANGTVIGSVSGIDPDAAPTFTYAFVAGQDAGGRFAISAGGQITVANSSLLDFEGAATHNVTVRVTDQGGLSFNKVFTINVTNTNEAPTDATLSANAVVENAANGTVVGSVSGIDPDAAPTFTYAFVAGQDAGGRFAISAGGQITVANGTLLDFESAASHNVTVRVTDQGGLTYDEVMTINVTNVFGFFTGTAGAEAIVGTSEEDLINGLAGNDTLTGGIGDDALDGGDDNDSLIGGFGNDVLTGGNGDDSIYDNSGADTIDGGTGIDTVSFLGSATSVNVNLTTGVGIGGDAAGDVYSNLENIIGGANADTLVGNTAANNIQGDTGNDTIEGRDNADSLYGGAGNDSLDGGIGDDLLEGGDDNDTLTGGAGADTMNGGVGTDTIYGDDNDVITTGLGNDAIYLDGSALTSAGTDIQAGGGGAEGLDTLLLTGTGTFNLAQLMGGVSGIETVDADASAIALDMSNATAADIRSILGISSGTGTLTLDFDGNDTFTVGAGQFTAFDGGTNTTTFFTDVTMTTELAKVQVI